MPKLTFKNGLPSSGEFRQALAEAMTKANPVDDLLMLSRNLHEYEVRYRMRSEDFYAKYQKGGLDDELQHCMEWASAYESFMETRKKIEFALMREAVYRPIEDIAA
ncbi:MAG: hypothetical protein DRI57_06945 [Deltaproteobacteria bacterium]|nr:MAG: hypothetical protein DRI57_06945 [Deltaproteobacteria bacterium]